MGGGIARDGEHKAMSWAGPIVADPIGGIGPVENLPAAGITLCN